MWSDLVMEFHLLQKIIYQQQFEHRAECIIIWEKINKWRITNDETKCMDVYPPSRCSLNILSKARQSSSIVYN